MGMAAFDLKKDSLPGIHGLRARLLDFQWKLHVWEMALRLSNSHVCDFDGIRAVSNHEFLRRQKFFARRSRRAASLQVLLPIWWPKSATKSNAALQDNCIAAWRSILSIKRPWTWAQQLCSTDDPQPVRVAHERESKVRLGRLGVWHVLRDPATEHNRWYNARDETSCHLSIHTMFLAKNCIFSDGTAFWHTKKTWLFTKCPTKSTAKRNANQIMLLLNVDAFGNILSVNLVFSQK